MFKERVNFFIRSTPGMLVGFVRDDLRHFPHPNVRRKILEYRTPSALLRVIDLVYTIFCQHPSLMSAVETHRKDSKFSCEPKTRSCDAYIARPLFHTTSLTTAPFRGRRRSAWNLPVARPIGVRVCEKSRGLLHLQCSHLLRQSATGLRRERWL